MNVRFDRLCITIRIWGQLVEMKRQYIVHEALTSIKMFFLYPHYCELQRLVKLILKRSVQYSTCASISI